MTPEQIAELDRACMRPPAPEADPHQALHSLYGRGDTVRMLAGQGERPQEIYTPQFLVDAIRILWPQGIALDPCHGPGSLVGAARVYHVAGIPKAKGKGTDYTPQPGELDGRALPWLPGTYCNPPFRDLKDWLEVWASAPPEALILGPARTHRKWYRAALRRATWIVWLDASFAFHGYDQSFPAPLALLYRGAATRAQMVEAFGHLGETTRWSYL